MQSIIHLSPTYFLSYASAVGKAEWEGPYGKKFDFHDITDRFGKGKWEQAEGNLSHFVLNLALGKLGMSHRDVSFLFSGDLQNQCVASSEGHLEDHIPYFGIYGACSTCTEGLLLSAVTLESMKIGTIGAAVTTSHNSAAERQFRTPLEYGGQRPPTAQWTATAGGAFLLTKETMQAPFISCVMPGVMVSGGVTDAFNMGAAMAPAAAHSIRTFLSLRGATVKDYDAIVTGDLGREGSALLEILLQEEGIHIAGIHQDCGAMLYDPAKKDCHSGGSGCGCSASLLAAHFLPLLQKGEFTRILFLSTGALMSPSSIQQGGEIIGIAPVIEICAPTQGEVL